MGWWPFSNKAEVTESNEPEENFITLYQTDPPHIRAEKIFRASGMGINHNALAMIPSAANAIAAYQRMDAEIAASHRKDTD
jgi:hypothetical protein